MAKSSDVPSLGRLEVTWYNAPLPGTLTNDSSNNNTNNNNNIGIDAAIAITSTSAITANGTATASTSHAQKSTGSIDVDATAAMDEGTVSSNNADTMKQPAIAVPEVDYDVADDDDDRWMAA